MASTPIKYLRRSLFGLAVLALAFWWYEYRPYSVRKQCASRIDLVGTAQTNPYYDVREADFVDCLHRHGLSH